VRTVRFPRAISEAARLLCMNKPERIYLHVWTGDHDEARRVAERQWPGGDIVEVSHQQLRSQGWKGQIRGLRALSGRALMVFFKSLDDAPQVQLVLWSGIIHHCKETVLADSQGRLQVYRRRDWLRLFPKSLVSAFADAFVLLFGRFFLMLWRATARPRSLEGEPGGFDVAYLFPYPLARDVAGGAISHIRGVLGGLKASGAKCKIFSGAPLPVGCFPLQLISAKRRFFMFWESLTLTYSVRFAQEVRHALRGARPRALYQRHGRFIVAGALLSQWTGIPLILEYNGSELWMADYWDPTRFYSWVRLCEEVTLKCASLIVVVSDPIKHELLKRGIAPERVVVSPNAVDPDHFHPGCGGDTLRQQLGIATSEIVVAFVGSFASWHGISVLQQAACEILQDSTPEQVRFLLIGDGQLRVEMRRCLERFEKTGQVIFTGILPHDRVRPYLDAADILVSPHVPLPDGKPFFGSPTKLFEYMAMGKAIVASNLDQLAQVLSHNQTALLVEPGSVEELVDAIRLLAQDSRLRRRLGQQAREAAVARHTWQQNVTPVLAFARREKKPNVSQITDSVTEKHLVDSGLE
jgi:glycosyltransferase involved in cell wall biosynthesis